MKSKLEIIEDEKNNIFSSQLKTMINKKVGDKPDNQYAKRKNIFKESKHNNLKKEIKKYNLKNQTDLIEVVKKKIELQKLFGNDRFQSKDSKEMITFDIDKDKEGVVKFIPENKSI